MKNKQTQKSFNSILKKGTTAVLSLAFMYSIAAEMDATKSSHPSSVIKKTNVSLQTTTVHDTIIYPGELLGINKNTWKVNSFIGPPSASAIYLDDMSKNVPDISKYFDKNYFYAADGYAVFHAYSGMSTSANSHNSRVELREMTTDGKSASWDGSEGTHTMTWTVNIAQLNQCDALHKKAKGNVLFKGMSYGKITFGQVHGPKLNKDGVKVDDIIRVQIEGRANRTSGSGYLVIGGYIAENFTRDGKDYTVPRFKFRLNRDYTFTIKYANSTVYLYNDDTLLYSQRMDTSCEENYFKAGCYLQGTNGKSGEGIYDFDGTGGIVKIKDLKVTHN